jgi:hypothetical protein
MEEIKTGQVVAVTNAPAANAVPAANAAPAANVAPAPAPAPQAPDAAPAPNAAQIELQQASIVPELVTQEGNPVLVVDTSEEAMARAGLREPKDVIPTMIATEEAPPAAAPSIRRPTFRRKAPAGQEQAPGPAPAQAPAPQQGGEEEESQVHSTPLQPIKVVKLG